MSGYKPTRKMTSVGVGGAFAVILVWVLSLFGVNMPIEVATAVAALLSFGAGYLIKEK